MGRAARTKRQRRNKTQTHQNKTNALTFEIWDPWTGAWHTAAVRAPGEALRKGEQDRNGAPDRPAEFETRVGRGWSTGAPALRSDRREMVLWTDHDARTLGLWYSRADESSVQIMVGRREDGAFVLEATVRTGQTEEHHMLECGDEIAARAWIDGLDQGLVAALGLPPLSWVSADELSAELLGR
jgi:hypothetical protein